MSAKKSTFVTIAHLNEFPPEYKQNGVSYEEVTRSAFTSGGREVKAINGKQVIVVPIKAFDGVTVLACAIGDIETAKPLLGYENNTPLMYISAEVAMREVIRNSYPSLRF